MVKFEDKFKKGSLVRFNGFTTTIAGFNNDRTLLQLKDFSGMFDREQIKEVKKC